MQIRPPSSVLPVRVVGVGRAGCALRPAPPASPPPWPVTREAPVGAAVDPVRTLLLGPLRVSLEARPPQRLWLQSSELARSRINGLTAIELAPGTPATARCSELPARLRQVRFDDRFWLGRLGADQWRALGIPARPLRRRAVPWPARQPRRGRLRHDRLARRALGGEPRRAFDAELSGWAPAPAEQRQWPSHMSLGEGVNAAARGPPGPEWGRPTRRVLAAFVREPRLRRRQAPSLFVLSRDRYRRGLGCSRVNVSATAADAAPHQREPPMHARPAATLLPHVATPHPGGVTQPSAGRRAVVGTAWALAWMLAWAGAILVFAARSQAEALPLAASVAPAPASAAASSAAAAAAAATAVATPGDFAAGASGGGGAGQALSAAVVLRAGRGLRARATFLAAGA